MVITVELEGLGYKNQTLSVLTRKASNAWDMSQKILKALKGKEAQLEVLIESSFGIELLSKMLRNSTEENIKFKINNILSPSYIEALHQIAPYKFTASHIAHIGQDVLWYNQSLSLFNNLVAGMQKIAATFMYKNNYLHTEDISLIFESSGSALGKSMDDFAQKVDQLVSLIGENKYSMKNISYILHASGKNMGEAIDMLVKHHKKLLSLLGEGKFLADQVAHMIYGTRLKSAESIDKLGRNADLLLKCISDGGDVCAVAKLFKKAGVEIDKKIQKYLLDLTIDEELNNDASLDNVDEDNNDASSECSLSPNVKGFSGIPGWYVCPKMYEYAQEMVDKPKDPLDLVEQKAQKFKADQGCIGEKDENQFQNKRLKTYNDIENIDSDDDVIFAIEELLEIMGDYGL